MQCSESYQALVLVSVVMAQLHLAQKAHLILLLLQQWRHLPKRGILVNLFFEYQITHKKHSWIRLILYFVIASNFYHVIFHQ